MDMFACSRSRRRIQSLLFYSIIICLTILLLNIFLKRNDVTMSQPQQRHLVPLRKLEPMFNRLKSFKNESDIIYVRKIAIRRRDKETSLAYIKSEERTLEQVTQHLEQQIKPNWFNYRNSAPGPMQVKWSKDFSVPEKFFGIEKEVIPKFRYTLNHPALCNMKDLNLLILVTSYVHNQKNRMAIRRSWGRLRKINNYSIKTVFLLGAGSAYYQTLAEAEESQFNDIIQQDFMDGFGQRTFKVMMAMQWFRNYCPNAEFVLIIGDNVLPNLYKVVATLQKMDSENDLYMGKVRYGDSPQTVSSDRYVSNVTWTSKHYPPFCERPFWFFSREVLDKMAAVVPYTTWLYPEDVYIGVLAVKVGVKVTDYSQGLIHSINEDPKDVLCDKKSPIMLADVIDDGNLPVMIMQTNQFIEVHNRHAKGVIKHRGRINPVTTGDVFVEM